jgi:serpin B
VVPATGKFQPVESSLNEPTIQAVIGGLKREEVRLAMPKFTFTSSFGLGATLGKLGMPIAFSGQADFSGMNGKRDLFISDVVHKAFVLVDETGTEAAAATGVVVGATAMPPREPIVLTIDRPFLFFIRDLQTDTILFMGRVVNPVK